ncbi:MAG TPA: UDP-glucuronic acid decarboxylase family protein [Bdellovibrionota bacterium]|jgi:dTDP-glucose 4,6-dehydratase
MAKKCVLITGAAGFIGSHLTDRFLKEGWAVLGVDNFLTGREENIASALKSPDFRFEKADVIKRFDFKNPFGGKFDWVYHFACPASPVDFVDLAQEIIEVDSIGTLKGLEFARTQGAGFYLASTSEVYGDPLVHPQTEDYWGNVNSIGPRSCYDETKRFSEAAVTLFHQKYKIDTRIVRIFNTYGPRMRLNDGRVVPALCSQALRGEKLTVHGDGSQTRSFCFVDDLVDGIYKLGQSKEVLPTNCGNPKEYSMNEFAKVVQKVAGTKLEIQYLPARPDDPRKRCPDISKARKLLNWEPKVALEDGLKKTLEAFKREL